jgi:hypothetical protein
MKAIKFITVLTSLLVLLLAGCGNQESSQTNSSVPEMATAIPPEITTPDRVETRIGTLNFFDGMPDRATVEKAYDNLDFLRGVEVFLNAMPGASVFAYRQGARGSGFGNGEIGIMENLMDSRSLFLTPNTETVYALAWLDLKDGPLVVESPPNVLGIVDDFWFRYVADLGNAGPDRGKGGKFLFLPPGYEGDVPEGYFVFRSSTFGNLIFWRGFLVNGDTKPAVANFKKNTRIYPLAKAGNPPEQQFVNLSGRDFNTIHANNFRFYEEINQLVQEEPGEAIDPDFRGLLAAIGIEKGKPFGPDARMKRILTDAAAVANATARSILFANRDKEFFLYPNSYWEVGFLGGSHEFLRDGARYLDARTRMFYYATGITPAMARKMVGVGSQYAISFRDSQGNYFNGGQTYRLNIPANPPVKDFWSIVVYDGQTRSMLQTDQQFPSLGSQKSGVVKNADGSVDVYFGPKAPPGKEGNWIQTVPGKSWNVILRLYGPLDPWFDKTWRPGDIELVD